MPPASLLSRAVVLDADFYNRVWLILQTHEGCQADWGGMTGTRFTEEMTSAGGLAQVASRWVTVALPPQAGPDALSARALGRALRPCLRLA